MALRLMRRALRGFFPASAVRGFCTRPSLFLLQKAGRLAVGTFGELSTVYLSRVGETFTCMPDTVVVARESGCLEDPAAVFWACETDLLRAWKFNALLPAWSDY